MDASDRYNQHIEVENQQIEVENQQINEENQQVDAIMTILRLSLAVIGAILLVVLSYL